MKTPTPPQKLYTRKQVAAMLAMSYWRVIELENTGQLAAVRDGRVIKFTAEEIDRYVADLPSHEPRSA